MENKVPEQKVSTEVAFAELVEFLKLHRRKEFRRNLLSDDQIKLDYPDLLIAIEDGLLTFNGAQPTYELRYPVDAENSIKKVVPRTRINPVDQANVMNGLDIQKEKGTFIIKKLCFICQISQGDLILMDNEDYETISQLAAVF